MNAVIEALEGLAVVAVSPGRFVLSAHDVEMARVDITAPAHLACAIMAPPLVGAMHAARAQHISALVNLALTANGKAVDMSEIVTARAELDATENLPCMVFVPDISGGFAANAARVA